MERSLNVGLSEKESPPPHPDDNRSTKKVFIRDEENVAAIAMETEEGSIA